MGVVRRTSSTALKDLWPTKSCTSTTVTGIISQNVPIVEEGGTPILKVPDDVMTLIFARLPRRSLAVTRAVCSSWKRVSEHEDLAVVRHQVGVTEAWIYVVAETPDDSPFRVYDPSGDTWLALPPAPGRVACWGQWQGFACVAVDHKLLIIGGTRISKTPTEEKYSTGVACSDVVVYNGLTNKWSRAASMSTPRVWFAATAISTKVYVAGGQSNTNFLDLAEVYDSQTDTWHAISSMGVQRSSCHGAAFDNKFWVIAGEYVKNHYTGNSSKSSAEVYNCDSDSWHVIPNMSISDSKVLGPCTVIDGRFIAVHQNVIMAYDQNLNKWNHLGHVKGGEIYLRPYCQFGFVCESIGKRLYIIGGTCEYVHHRNRYCTQLYTVEICELDVSKQYSSQLWWTAGANMTSYGRGVMVVFVVMHL